jgi:hypothetical protein
VEYTLPKCPPHLISDDATFAQKLGFNMRSDYLQPIKWRCSFSMFLGARITLTNMYGDVFYQN